MVEARPDVKMYLEAMQASGAPSVIDIEPVAARSMMRQAAPLTELSPREMRRVDIAIPSRGTHAIPARIYSPVQTRDPAPVMVFYHGGGWVFGDVEGYDPLCSEIAYQLGMTVLSVDYRLAPEHLFPAAVEDSLDAAKWVGDSPEIIGHPVSGIVFAGDSAGGSLAAAVTREMMGTLPIPIRAQWLIYPVTDLSVSYPSDKELSAFFNLTEASTDAFYRYYFGDGDMTEKKRHPHVSPLLGDTWQGLPPAVVFTCSLDPLRDQGRAYAAKLTANGVDTVFLEARGQVHACFTMRRMLPSAQRDLLENISALKIFMAR